MVCDCTRNKRGVRFHLHDLPLFATQPRVNRTSSVTRLVVNESQQKADEDDRCRPTSGTGTDWRRFLDGHPTATTFRLLRWSLLSPPLRPAATAAARRSSASTSGTGLLVATVCSGAGARPTRTGYRRPRARTDLTASAAVTRFRLSQTRDNTYSK